MQLPPPSPLAGMVSPGNLRVAEFSLIQVWDFAESLQSNKQKEKTA